MTATDTLPTTEVDDECESCAELRDRVATLRGLIARAEDLLGMATQRR